MRILLVKPYQELERPIQSPPLGLLHLAATVRERFGSDADVSVIDMKAKALPPAWLSGRLKELAPDVVGVSALNCEASASAEIASVVKKYDSNILTVLGGPYAHRRGEEILRKTDFDWCFSGPADRVFPEALARHFGGAELGTDIRGLSYTDSEDFHVATDQDAFSDLDSLPLPAWDLVDFDLYVRLPNVNNMLKGRRYATLFTSRGCPYKCNYCHDIFSKRFYHRSAEHVLAEIEVLYERYGVDEFQIIDDIFNLHKPRLKKIMSEVSRRWPGKLHFCFPNGLRGDILDESVLDALKDAGTYHVAIAIETVTPRLQHLVEKELKVEKALAMIDASDRRGFVVQGLFMLGFPTETREELESTVACALRSRLTLANFFEVIPQPATPLYDLATAESHSALVEIDRRQESGVGYLSSFSWYEGAYGFPLSRFTKNAHLRFYLNPWRMYRLITRLPTRTLLDSARAFIRLLRFRVR